MPTRNTCLGFDSIEEIPGREQKEVMRDVKGETGFRPEILFIASTVAPSFEILGILIGDKPQLSESSYPIPGEMFTAGFSQNWGLDFDDAAPGEVVTLIVRNLSEGALRFTAAYLGPPIKT